jgi:hypothetical protein
MVFTATKLSKGRRPPMSCAAVYWFRQERAREKAPGPIVGVGFSRMCLPNYTMIAVAASWLHRPRSSWPTPLFFVFMDYLIYSSSSLQTQRDVPCIKQPHTQNPPGGGAPVDLLPPCNHRPQYHQICHSHCPPYSQVHGTSFQ